MSTLPSTHPGTTEPHLGFFLGPNPQQEQTAPDANTQVNGDTEVKHYFFRGGSNILLLITETPRLAYSDPLDVLSYLKLTPHLWDPHILYSTPKAKFHPFHIILHRIQ